MKLEVWLHCFRHNQTRFGMVVVETICTKRDCMVWKKNWLLWGAKCLVKQPLTGLCSHSQPPLVQTHTVTITAVSNSLPGDISTTEVPIVPTKTFTYESSKVGAPAPAAVQSRSNLPPELDKLTIWWSQRGGRGRGAKKLYRTFLRKKISVKSVW